MGSIAAGIVGTAFTSQAQRQQGQIQQQLADQNSVLAARQAQDALARGNTQAGIAEAKGSALAGQEKVDYAASGVDASSGSAATTQLTTKAMADLDASIIKNNAARQAWGYKVQGLQDVEQGELDKQAGDNAARGTLLTGGANAANQVWSLGSSYGRSGG